MATGNVVLMHECFPQHSCMKKDKDTEEEGKHRGVNMESRTGTIKRSPDGLTIALAYPPQGSLFFETVNKLPNLTLCVQFIYDSLSGFNNNNHCYYQHFKNKSLVFAR